MGGEAPSNLLRILWRISLMAFGLARSAGVHAVTFAQVVPYARSDRTDNEYR
jgi:hypothetical protein